MTPPSRMRSSSWSAEHRLLLPMQGNDAAFEARRCCFARTRHIEPDALVTQGIVCDDLAALIERLAAHEPGFRLAG
jgi:hypothetical protein